MKAEIVLPSWRGSRERYYLVDLDGKAELHAYQQRPTAERHATRSGYGLYDIREDRMVVEPDVEMRLRWHRDSVVRHKEDLNQALKRLMLVEEAAEKERESHAEAR